MIKGRALNTCIERFVYVILPRFLTFQTTKVIASQYSLQLEV